MAPFPKWLYDLATELEHGIRDSSPAHIELARLLPDSLRVAARVMADYNEVSGMVTTPPPAARPDRSLIDTTDTPVMPLHLSPLMASVTPVVNPGEVTGTHMIPANGAS